MEDQHRYFPTPTCDSRIGFSCEAAPRFPGISEVGGIHDSAHSSTVRGRKKFINSRSFCTLATKLCSSSHQATEVDREADTAGCAVDANGSHSEIDSNEISDSDFPSGCPYNNASPIPDCLADSSSLIPQTCFGLSQVSGVNNHHEPRNRIDSNLMGSLLKNAGLAYDKSSSLGFSASSDSFMLEDVSDRDSMDLPHIRVQDRQNVFTYSDTTTGSDKVRTGIINSQALSSSEPYLNVTDCARVDTDQGHDAVVSDIHEVMSTQGAIPSVVESSYEKSMSTDNDDVPIHWNLPTDEPELQHLCPSSTTSHQAPTFRRQLSKRKSDTFEAFLPEEAAHLYGDEQDEEDDFFSATESHGKRSDPCTPTTPKSRRLENYDPYQIFEVQHTPCLILTVRILRGRNITLGFQDYYDTPDPYLNLVLRSSPEGRKSTSVKENDTNPEWDETFTFYINFTQANILEISLMESNSLWFDQKVGTVYYDLVNIHEMEKPQNETFVFNKVSEVDIEFKLEFDRNPTLRYSLCLSSLEKEFIEQRKEMTLEGMRKFLGDEDAPQNIDEVPTIAVIGSGGGFRAMTGYSGVFKALVESGVLDCTMYACGLSGSSWLLSTLYSHPKWPNLDMAEFLDELKHNVDKSLLRFLNASTMYSYIKFMIQKRKDGQPVSFTDIFGRMVGETLLKDRMETTLSDQREKIKGGAVPMPIYTCVHVKKDVPARSFQEWVEFSPYEIGLPKYGTFMDSELFGSKFFMGKLVKQYKEQPLHFLQGIWGSAFCILFKRLLEDNRRIDPVEMVRQEMGKQLDEARQESSSDCSDDEIDLSSDSIDGNNDFAQNSENGENTFDNGEPEFPSRINISPSDEVDQKDGINNEEKKEQKKLSFRNQGIDDISSDGFEEDDSAYEGEEEDSEEDNDTDESEVTEIHSQRMLKRGSIEMKRGFRNQQSSKDSASPENDLTQEHIDVPHLPTPFVSESDQKNQPLGNELEQSYDRKKSVNWGACPTLGKKAETKETNQRRQAFVSGTSMRKSRSGSKSYWNQVLKKVFESKSWELLSTRRGRAAVIHNFMRGLSLQQSYPLSPFTPVEDRVKAGEEFDGIFEMHPTSVKHIYMVDAGLTFNSPFPLVLRPQRDVDIILSFDFSARDSDNSQPFKELLLAEKWAKLNRLPFPPIDTSVYEREGMKELYIFRHPTEPHCPIVLHFVLVNKRFKYYKKPDVPRETKEEFEFAEFDIFDDPKAAYSTFNFTYAHKSFERLSQLMEFNTLLHIDDIKQVIKDVIKTKREGPPKLPIKTKDIKLLQMKSVQEMRKLRRFLFRMESRNSIYAGTSPSTPYFTPTPNYETSSNPFFSKFPQDVSLSPSHDNCPHTPDRISESFPRTSRVKKHLHPNDVFPESEKINYLQSTNKDVAKKSRGSQNSSSFESACDVAPDSSGHFHHIGQTSYVLHSHSNTSQPHSEDVCDGLVQSDLKYSLENTTSTAVISGEANTISDANQSSNNTSTTIQTDVLPAKNTNKWSTTPQQSQLLGTLNYSRTQTDSTGTNSSGYDSLGADMSIDRIRRDDIHEDNPGESTPATGTFSIDSFSSGSTGAKGKPRTNQPPNPFFAKAFFMRTSPSTLQSSSSTTSLSPMTPQSSNSTKDVVGRLNLRSPHLSPLVVSSNNKPKLVPKVQPVQSPTTPEIFSLAPEAFKADGTPVFDSQQAKMYYESAKSKRKFFRRQSTVSSLKSISLDEHKQSDCEINDINQEGWDNVNQLSPNKKKMTHSDTHFMDFFKTCDEGGGLLSNVSSITATANEGKPQTVKHTPGYGVDLDIGDLSHFTGVSDMETQQVKQAVVSLVSEVSHQETKSHANITWPDAEDNTV